MNGTFGLEHPVLPHEEEASPTTENRPESLLANPKELAEDLSYHLELGKTEAEMLMTEYADEVFANRERFSKINDLDLALLAIQHNNRYTLYCHLGELTGLTSEVAQQLINHGYLTEIIRHRDSFIDLTDEQIAEWSLQNPGATLELIGAIPHLDGYLLEVAKNEKAKIDQLKVQS